MRLIQVVVLRAEYDFRLLTTNLTLRPSAAADDNMPVTSVIMTFWTTQ